MTTPRSQQHRLTILLALNLTMTAGLITAGYTAHSLGTLAAGGDYIADSAAIGLGIIAVHRAHLALYVAGINAGVLLVGCGFVILEGARRLTSSTPSVHGLPVLAASGTAAVVMIAGVLIIGDTAGNGDLHMRSVLLDTIGDAFASAAVAVSGLIMWLTGRVFWLDPLFSIVIATTVSIGALRLLRDITQASTTRKTLAVKP